MKKIFILLAVIASIGADAQSIPACRTSEMTSEYYSVNPQAQIAHNDFEVFTRNFIANPQQQKTTANDTFIIPVVFHVYGTSQGGYTINDALIKLALKGVNNDFNGLNADYGTVHTQFMPLRSTLKIRFALAQKDPNGLATTGIKYYPVKKGYGKASAMNVDIAADAWDNYKYMNVYVMEDIYDDGITNNSGVAWYPDTVMSNKNTARVVYNGKYLATNNTVNPEFASVLTHEFSHFFNLIHTFEGGCTAPNDEVADTPPCTTAQGCHTTTTANAPLNCNSALINAENYMDYNTNCYKMFTKGQTDRMTAAMEHPARKPLWQHTNLVTTGLATPDAIAGVDGLKEVNIYPNPTNGIFTIDCSSKNYTVDVMDMMGKMVMEMQSNTAQAVVNLSGHQPGIYFVRVGNEEAFGVYKVRLQ